MPIYPDLPAKVRKAMEDRGWTQAELAKEAGLSQPTVSELVRGITVEVKLDTVAKIARALRKDLSYFTGRRQGNTAVEPVVPYWRAPIISWVQAGRKNAVADPHHPGAADEWEDVTVPASKATFALRVRGDSMVAPDGSGFPEGTVIIVDPEIEARHGDYVVVRFQDSDEATFKRLIVDGPMKLLKPLNTSYPTIQVTEDARLAGVVVESNMRKKFR